ncbi:MAG TPA: hypothetical protein VES20_09995 [Bryobacteraceae bacterium]|nr:hypothetical protein [Bryobacteraceae bacterium]
MKVPRHMRKLEQTPEPRPATFQIYFRLRRTQPGYSFFSFSTFGSEMLTM